MTRIVVNNIDELFNTQNVQCEARSEHRRRVRGTAAKDPQADEQADPVQREVSRIRGQIDRIACSATWAEDCLYRGAQYAPDFRCQCGLCRAEFPDRLHPRSARQSQLSLDCQVENEEDPELAEDLARLRNDRIRVGSVFLALRRRDFSISSFQRDGHAKAS